MKKMSITLLLLFMGQCATMNYQTGGRGTAVDEYLKSGLLYTPYRETNNQQPVNNYYIQQPEREPAYTEPSYADSVDTYMYGGY